MVHLNSVQEWEFSLSLGTRPGHSLTSAPQGWGFLLGLGICNVGRCFRKAEVGLSLGGFGKHFLQYWWSVET